MTQRNSLSLNKSLALAFLTFALLTPGMSQDMESIQLTDIRQGKSMSLKNDASRPAIVLLFISQACPFTQYYINRINTLIQGYGTQVDFWLINANGDETRLPDTMKQYLAAQGWDVPYLADPNQTLAQKLNISKNPEVIVMKNQQGKFALVYRGAIDDNPQAETDVRASYLSDALEALLAGKTQPRPMERPVGCALRKK